MQGIYGSENRIEQLKLRTERCVCKYCGKKIRLKQIIFNDIDEARVELFCDNCDSIEYGVEPQLYQCAKSFVENFEFNCYDGLDDNEKTKKMNIAKVCEILTWTFKSMDMIGPNGIQMKDTFQVNDWAECLIQTADQIDSSKDFAAYVEELSCQ